MNGQRLVGLEPEVTFDRQAEPASEGGEFRNGNRAEFGFSETEIAEPEGDVGLFRVEFGEEPGCTGIG